MTSKKLFAVLLTVGMLLATGVVVATVAIGPTFAGPTDSTCSNVK